VGITSAVPAEGKTTTAMSLARVCALSGQRVLIVDCDLRRRSLDRYLPEPARLGLLQVLVGETAWKDILQQDLETSVHILPAAPASFTPRDVFGSESMTRLLDEVRRHYDLVICDCAPVLAVAETRVLAKRMDTMIMVARAAKTPAKATRAAFTQLRDVGASVAGVALNGLDAVSARGGYYDSPYYSKAYEKYYAN
jgi:capsular exopolysaccharide synthesis family protein